MKTCTICKGSIAYPEIQGKTHFVCDGRVPARKQAPFIQGMIASQSSADARWTRQNKTKLMRRSHTWQKPKASLPPMTCGNT
jgi:hypothetical protein